MFYTVHCIIDVSKPLCAAYCKINESATNESMEVINIYIKQDI